MNPSRFFGGKYSQGMTLLEVMVAIALLVIGICCFLQTAYSVSTAQKEIYDRFLTMATIEQIAEGVMAYTGDSVGLYDTYHDPPDVVIKDNDTLNPPDGSTEVARVTITKTFESVTEPGESLEVHLTLLRYDPE